METNHTRMGFLCISCNIYKTPHIFPETITGLFCTSAQQKRLYSAKETYNFKEPTDRVLCILRLAYKTSPLRFQVSFAKEPYTLCVSLGNTWGVLCITRQFAMETYHTRMSCVLYVSKCPIKETIFCKRALQFKGSLLIESCVYYVMRIIRLHCNGDVSYARRNWRVQVSFAKEAYTQCASLGNTWGVLCITRQFAMETYPTRMSCVLYVCIANFIVNFAMMTTRNRWCILCWRVTGCCKRAHIVNVAVSFLDIANFLA